MITPIFALRRRSGKAAVCRDHATQLLHEVARGFRFGVRHEWLITEAALVWRDASHLEPSTLN